MGRVHGSFVTCVDRLSFLQLTPIAACYVHRIGCLVQVLIQVEHESSVIMWDFDILKGDVTFTMFRCRDMIGAELAHQHHVSGGAGGIWSVQYIGRSMVVGADLSIVEPPHICRDGDSLQVRARCASLVTLRHVVDVGCVRSVLGCCFVDSVCFCSLLVTDR